MARKTFEQITDYWQFKGYRLLKDAIERATPLAASDRDREVLERMTKVLKEIMGEALIRDGMDPTEAESLVLQTGHPGKYNSGLIAGRFQILESVISGSYYVVDHERDDLILRVGGPASDIRRFGTIPEAEALIDQFTSGTDHGMNSPPRNMSSRGSSQEGLMAKNPKALAAAKKAAAAADAALDSKPKKAAIPAKKAAVAPAPAKKAAPAEGRKMPDVRAGAPTVANFTRSLIMEGKRTEAQIVDAVREQFPDKSIAKNVAAHYRSQLEKNGSNPPPFKAG